MSTTPADFPEIATATAARPVHAAAHTHARTRLQSIDVIRGLVMVLMTLDHVRHYFTNAHFEVLDPDLTTGPLYLTRWITHLCAPTFVFLAGVSAYLMSRRCTRNELSRFLFTRGLWLVVLEITVVNLSWTFDPTYRFGLFLQVIWAIGVSMVALAALVRLPVSAVFTIAMVIIAGHNLLDGIAPEGFGAWAVLWKLLHVGGPVAFGFVAYPVLPWIGVMALGYALGSLYQSDARGHQDAESRQRWLLAAGSFALIAFFVLRLINGYGDPKPWSGQATFAQTLFSFFDVQKYPPSLMYVLATLGIAFLLLSGFERLEGRGPNAGLQVLRTFGRVPLFFYVLHLVLAHLSAGLVALATGYGFNSGLMVHSFFSTPEGWGYSLPVVYLIWLAVLLVSYPLCRWFAGVKQRRNDWWLSYL